MIKSTKWVEVEVKKLIPALWNYKTDDEDQAAKLLENIRRNGQVENILVRDVGRGKYEVVNGNHRLTVFEKLKFKKVVCFNLGKISDSQAKRIAIETNETRFESDTIKLAQTFKDILGDDGFQLEELEKTMPYDAETLTGFTEMLDFNWSQFDKPEDEDPDPRSAPKTTTVECPHCHEEFEVED